MGAEEGEGGEEVSCETVMKKLVGVKTYLPMSYAELRRKCIEGVE